MAAMRLLGRAAGLPDPQPARRLANGLQDRAARAARHAQAATRHAISAATAETAPELARHAVTGHVNRAGARLPLSVYVEVQVETVGRHLTSQGTADALVNAGQPMVKIEGSGGDAICDHWIAQESVHAQGAHPPYHPRCQCVAVPIGSSTAAQVAAMQDMRKAYYREHFAAARQRARAAAA